MKKILATALVVCFVAGTSFASITGSAHDFGGQAWSENQICQPCHTPHGATLKDAAGKKLEGPLWNHELSTATYTLYLDATGTGVTGDVDQNSKLCLSCHDGTVALDSFGGVSGSTTITDPDRVFGTDLSKNHPIGSHAVYPTASYMVATSYRTTAGIMPLRTMADGTTMVVGCTTCHEPHNRKGLPHLLWAPMSGTYTTVDARTVSGSGLCMNCHKK